MNFTEPTLHDHGCSFYCNGGSWVELLKCIARETWPSFALTLALLVLMIVTAFVYKRKAARSLRSDGPLPQGSWIKGLQRGPGGWYVTAQHEEIPTDLPIALFYDDGPYETEAMAKLALDSFDIDANNCAAGVRSISVTRRTNTIIGEKESYQR